ncbi:MAG: hypothetical protein QOD93_3171 [Acetobacteraceae bacterium]|jgi:hypothetical protein|nr:hypothetical protein [Acetobacteraceae bacterium]
MTDETPPSPDRWLLLIHQLPAKPAYFRVKIWRRLQGLGAVAVKNAVYALPANDQTQEDFEWLLKEIVEGGGEAMVCEARLIDGLSDQEVRALFNAARDEDYETVAKEARLLADVPIAELTTAPRAEARGKLTKLKTRALEIVAIDFYGANGRETVDGLLAMLDATLREEPLMKLPSDDKTTFGTENFKGRTWVTRQGVHVDRIASAWLIRRFIDRDARFKFVRGKDYTPALSELRFDMFEAEFTHEGDRCTFEVLLARTGLEDAALRAIGDIVHDIDLKDGKFGREETSGIAHLIAGLTLATQGDDQRLARGAAVFDDLYAYFRKKRD